MPFVPFLAQAATSPERLVGSALLGVLALLVLVIRFKLHAFLALLLASFGVGLGAGLEPVALIKSVQKGMGDTLGFIALVVGLGAMFGKLLEVSGGAERLARTLLEAFGDARAPWALGLIGFLISIPIFLDVGLILVIPIVYSLTLRTGKPLLYYGIPLLAGLAVSHSFIPPTPGPIAVAKLLKAELGWVILFGVVAGLPAMVVAGPLFGRFVAARVKIGVPEFLHVEGARPDAGRPLPAFGIVLSLILAPLALILLGATAPYLCDPAENPGTLATLSFLGHPFVALLISTLLAAGLLKQHGGYTSEQITEVANRALEPAGIIILVTGAGGVFKQVMIDSGVGQMLGARMADLGWSPVALAFVIASLVRVAQGSATVAMITTAGLMAPINVALGLTLPDGAAAGAVGTVANAAPLLGLQVIAIACGATVLSHVNDSGFWLVNRFFGLSVKDTLKTWTVMETLIGLVGFSIVFAISLFL
jgi:Gnt-I system low-affinity gluconate transporter